MVSVRQMDEYLAQEKQKNFLALADISCDLKGALEFMDHPSTIDAPFYHYPYVVVLLNCENSYS
jgi:alpha-aminoadipic semialdehyde synthase